MKHFALSLVALFSLSSTAMAQDDVYFVPSKKTTQQHTAQQISSSSQRNKAFDYDDWAEHRVAQRDIDDYNRRSKHSRRGAADSLQTDDEQSMTARIVRFRSPRGVLVSSPWYDTYYYDLAYYDP
ncbi:MAG: hypothetical protein Q4D66_00585, partial [Bacteroidales bacterium]|nr:hypothetical protein [Bacteroidales bacterium]